METMEIGGRNSNFGPSPFLNEKSQTLGTAEALLLYEISEVTAAFYTSIVVCDFWHKFWFPCLFGTRGI